MIVLANFSTDAYPDYHVGVPRPGRWRVRFNSDWDGYDPEFETVDSLDADSEPEEHDGMAQRIAVGLGPYSVVILSPGRVGGAERRIVACAMTLVPCVMPIPSPKSPGTRTISPTSARMAAGSRRARWPGPTSSS